MSLKFGLSLPQGWTMELANLDPGRCENLAGRNAHWLVAYQVFIVSPFAQRWLALRNDQFSKLFFLLTNG